MKKRLFNLFLIILWAFLIFYLSNQNGSDSTNLTENFIFKIFGINSYTNILFIFIRKIAHFTEYLILGMLVYNFINSFNIDNKIIISILLCSIYAATDEFHQIFIIGRECKLLDVLIDTFGSITGIIIIKIFSKVLLKKQKK